MTTDATWTVVLGISKLSVPVLIDRGYQVFNDMTGPLGPPPVPNPNFTAPNPAPANPSLGNFKTHLDALQGAKTSTTLAGKAKTFAIKAAKKVVLSDFKSIGNYIEIVANMDTNFEHGDQVIESAGLTWKKKPTKTKVEDLVVKPDPDANGSVIAQDKRFEDGCVYTFRYKLKTATEWITAHIGIHVKFIYTDIDATVITQFQVIRSHANGSTSASSIRELPTNN